VDGVLVIDKPAGPSSHDVVAAVRKELRIKKVGHTGTLDPTATGVLPLVLGQATKLARYLSGGDKTYLATVRLGITTTTLDAAGEKVSERPVSVSAEQIAAEVAHFVGEIEQIPPMYSAKKIDGHKLYELARKGVEVPREAKRVTIYAIELKSVTLPEIVIEVRCSAGTYVRVLAQDLGERLGCGAHLHSLHRLRAGPFSIQEAISLQAALDQPDMARAAVVSIDRALADMPHIALPTLLVRQVQAGYQLTVADLRNLDLPDFGAEQALALRSDAGVLVAVAHSLIASQDLGQHRRDTHALKTERVL